MIMDGRYHVARAWVNSTPYHIDNIRTKGDQVFVYGHMIAETVNGRKIAY
jgi:hypothetical protein